MPTVLAVDDNSDNLVSLSAILNNLMPDCTVITALSGMEALEKIGAEPPDAILLDVKMPDMDGFETCRRLKADERTNHIPIIMITALKTDARSRIKGLEAGADSFLAKPIDDAELVTQVRVALRIKKAEDDLRRERDNLAITVRERTTALEMEISDRKRIEEELQRALVELEQCVAERTEELRQTNEELLADIAKREHTEANFRRSLEESPLGIRIVNAKRETLYANRAILDIYGFDSLEEFEATPVKRRYTPESYAEYLIRRKKIQGGMAYPPEYTLSIIRKNGDVRHLRVFRKKILWDGNQQYQVIYSDITEINLAEERLSNQAKQLEETNTALRVFLGHQDEALRKVEEKITANLKKLVIPYIKELRKHRLNPSQSSYLDIIDTNLQQVISPFLQNLSSRYSVLTPREIEIASLIKEGKTSKEIATLVKSAQRSVETHRNNIRKKMGMTGKKANLRSFLLTLS